MRGGIRLRGLTSNGGGGVGVGNHLVTDHDGLRVDLPESRGGVDGDAGQLSSKAGLVNSAKVVGTSRVVLEIDREHWHSQLWHNGVEESGLLGRLNSVEFAESETHETVVVGVLNERLRDSSGKLNGLLGGSGAADVDDVHSDGAGSS